ncbi:MAG: HD domain-containing protein [Oscillospiraceae bacterium]|nr:HD domain-containing protein [Oscillospiraceae bacterium]
MDKTIINYALEFVRNTFNNDYSGHDYFHTLRVYKMAARIAEQENADLMIVQLAALLHDVDDIKLSPETYANKDRAVEFLRKHSISEEMIKTICNIIGEVSFKGTDSVTPETIEGMCVQDADRLDAMGAIGIARTFAYGGSHNRIIHDPEIKPTANMNFDKYQSHISTSINHFYEKLFQLKDLMNTDTAKKIAEKRENYMRTYISEFLDEWDGIR